MDNKKKILIIEDETALLYALQSQLGAAGFKIFTADDGEKALKMVGEYKPDLIVLDLLLPKVDGWTFLSEVKKQKETKDIPVVIISNLSDDASQKRGFELGAKDYLAKVNYSMDELVEKIKAMI